MNLDALRRNTYVLAPCLILLILIVPAIAYLLPNYESALGEEYQPLQALKFFEAKGASYHKYGPMSNFLLAPGYGVSLAYWYATGSFKNPSEDFPYGFQSPLHQLTVLIVQGRILFTALALIAFGILARTLHRQGYGRAGVGVALMLCLCTGVPMILNVPSTRPDSPMLTFVALALAVYAVIVHKGLTIRRGVLLSALAVCAITSKELAGPLFVLPYLGIGLTEWRRTRGDAVARSSFVKAAGAAVATGPLLYALLNIVYAPATWLKRMQFWIGGPGADDAVWGSESGFGDHLAGITTRMVANLGPAGTVLVVAALALLLWRRPRHTWMLLLPFVSVMLLGLLPMGYSADRFFTIAALALLPPVAMGLDAGFKELAGSPKRVLAVACAVALVVNTHYALFAWISLDQSSESLLEHHLRAEVDKSEQVNVLSIVPRVPGKSRIEWMGYTLDPRPIQEIAADPESRPDWIFVNASVLGFIEDSAKYPERAKMLHEESGFDIAQWRGVEAIGYTEAEPLTPKVPGWFPYRFMQAVKNIGGSNRVRVFRRAE